MAAITPAEFKLLADYIYRVSGIYLEPEKKYLLETRLGPLLSAYQCSSFHELHQRTRQDAGQELKKAIINAISTNETLFFRDQKPFELLKHKIIPDLIDRRPPDGRGQRRIRIWSAACSTGQEVYSIIISLLEVLGNLDAYDLYVLGTDISDEAIDKASYGSYSKFEIERGLPRNVLQRYFQPVANGWRIKDEVRSRAVFKKFNLMDSYNQLGVFDIIFCRNVAIYFADQDKKKLFQKLGRVLAPDGYLLIGGSESLTGIAPQFEARHYLQGIFYQLQGAEVVPNKRPFPAAGPRSPGEKKAPRRRPAGKPASRPAVPAAGTKPPGRKPGERPPQESEPAAAVPPAGKIPPLEAAPEPSPEAAVHLSPAAEPGGSFLQRQSCREQDAPSLLGQLHNRSQEGFSPLVLAPTSTGDSLLQKLAEGREAADADRAGGEETETDT